MILRRGCAVLLSSSSSRSSNYSYSYSILFTRVRQHLQIFNNARRLSITTTTTITRTSLTMATEDVIQRKPQHPWKRPPETKSQRNNKKRKKEITKKYTDKGIGDDILLHDVDFLLLSKIKKEEEGEEAAAAAKKALPEKFSEIELDIAALSSSGDGLALSEASDHVYVIPFSLPGDRVVAKVITHFEKHSLADFVRVITPSPDRDDSLVFCKYFSSCGGCQLQMLPYAKQLEHKRIVIKKAFANFSGLVPELIPEVEQIMPSPRTMGYRTKLTPHFDGPRSGGFKADNVPDIGFLQKGRRRTMDIEDCPIGTDAVRDGLKQQREYVKNNITKYKRGATLLIREDSKVEDGKVLERSFITDSKSMVTEMVGDYCFKSPAGSFFQNNNSILKEFTDFVREKLALPIGEDVVDSTSPPTKYLVDAYCGSGLFTITCGTSFTSSIGIDISPQSIDSAHENAKRNNVQNATFMTGEAEKIFAKINFEPNDTSVVIDPPRKGCDELFLQQLVDLGPRRIIYISCNVHTLARDIGWILSSENGKCYAIDHISGFDFFPQTHHVEGCTVLTKREVNYTDLL